MWPRWIDPSSPGAKPYDGWPITMDQLDNGLSGAKWQLEDIDTNGFRNPVVQVQNSDGEIVYILRINGDSFTPPVRDPGVYTVTAFHPDGITTNNGIIFTLVVGLRFRNEFSRDEGVRKISSLRFGAKTSLVNSCNLPATPKACPVL